MIEFKVNKGVVGSMSISGTVSDLLADITFAIGYIHSRIKMHNEDCADIFESMLTQLFADKNVVKMVFSFPTEDEIEDEVREAGISNLSVDEENLRKQLAELMANRDKRQEEKEQEDEAE